MRTLITVALATCLLGANGAATAEKIHSPKKVVIAFYRMALMDFRPKEAFAQYAAPDFVEHSADSAGGTAQSTITFLTDLIHKSPQPKWEIVRIIAENDLVFLHVRFTPAPGATPVVVGEIFRVRHGRLAEHWDIIQHPPEHPVNPNSVF